MVDHNAKFFVIGSLVLFLLAIITREAVGFVTLDEEGRRDFLQFQRPEIINNDKSYLMNSFIDQSELERVLQKYDGSIPTRTQDMFTLEIVYRIQNWTITDQNQPRRTARFDQMHRRRRRLKDHTENHNFSKSIKRWGLLEKGSLILIDDIEKDIKRLPMWQKLCQAESDTHSACSHDSFMSPIDVLSDAEGNLFIENLN